MIGSRLRQECWFATLTCCLFVMAAPEQSMGVEPALEDIDTLPAKAFEAWVEQALNETPYTQRPDFVVEAVVRRLEAERITGRSAIVDSLRRLENYEGQMKDDHRAQTVRYATRLIPLLEHDVVARAKVRMILGDALMRADEKEPAQAQYEAAADELVPERVEVVKALGEANTDAGYRLLAQDQDSAAEARFDRTLSIAWWVIPAQPEDKHTLVHHYTRAAEGKIAANKGNLQKLESLRFAPAVMGELRDRLDLAIREAREEAGGRSSQQPAKAN